MGLRYRAATSDDAEAVAHLHALSWTTAYRGAYLDFFLDGPVWEERRGFWTERLADLPSDQFVVVADDDGELVGFACVTGAHHDELGSYLDNLHVAPDRHRQGIGKQLIAEVAAWCRGNYPSCGLYLGVLEQNERAQKFYASLGATDRFGQVVEATGGGRIAVRRYAWDSLDDVRV
jgi:GNAT superfamily N-acetyltransferase